MGLERPLWLREVEAPRTPRQSAHESGKVVGHTHRQPLTPHPQEILLVLILLVTESTPEL